MIELDDEDRMKKQSKNNITGSKALLFVGFFLIIAFAYVEESAATETISALTKSFAKAMAA